MKKKLGIWDWVYVIWTLVVCLLALCAYSAAASEPVFRSVLNDFRQGLSHAPGRGLGRGSAQLRQEGTGNAVELTNACWEYLTQRGYDCQVVSGRVRLSPVQAAGWTALPPEGIQRALGDELNPVVHSEGGLAVDMPWLQVLSGNLWGFGVADDRAAIRVNVFPALISQQGAPSDDSAAIVGAATRLRQGVGEIAITDYGVAGMAAALVIRRFPATMVAEQVTQCLAEDAVAAVLQPTTNALPGYRGVSCLSSAPVAILEEYGRFAAMPPEQEACVLFRLLADGHELLRWRCPQEGLGNQCFAVQWREEIVPDVLRSATGDDARSSWRPQLSLGGQVVAEGEVTADDNASLTLFCCRYADAAATLLSDQFSFAIASRRECCGVVSTGTMAAPNADDDMDAVARLALRCTYLLDSQCRIAAAEFGWQDCASLRVLLLQREGTGPSVSGTSGGASSWRLVLPEEGVQAYASTQAGVHPTTCRHAWSMAMAFAPMLALEWLSLGDDSMTFTSGLNAFREAFQDQRPWLYLPADVAMTDDDAVAPPWLSLAAADPQALWLGASGENRESPSPLCSWPEAQNVCRLQVSSSAGTVTSAAVIRLDETTGAADAPVGLDAFCRTYQRVLALIRQVVNTETTGLPTGLRELTALALMVQMTDAAAALPRIESIAAPAYWSRAAGEYPIGLQLTRTAWWSLGIENADGELQWRQRGTDRVVELRWPLHDLRQYPCVDGSYVLRLHAGDGQRVDEQRRCVVLDSQAPALRLQVQSGTPLPCVRYAVNDASPTAAELLLLDDAGTVMRRWDTLQINAPAELSLTGVDLAAGSYVLVLCAEDAAGNRAREELALDLPGGQGVLPELRLHIVGHDGSDPVLTTDTRLEVLAKGIVSLQECALLLDGDILLAVGPGPSLTETLFVSQWPAGRHVLTAVAWDDAGNEYCSDDITCHLRPDDNDDDLPPLLEVAFDGWPPDDSSAITVSAWDNRDLQGLRVWLDGELLGEAGFASGTQEGQLAALPLSASAFVRGVWLQAVDRAGNLQQRLLRYPDAAEVGAEKPLVVLCSPQLNDGPLQGDIAYQLYKESVGELAYLSLRLNGETLIEEYFPRESEFAGTIPLASCRVGENLLELQAVGVNGVAADTVVARFTVPVIADMSLTPDVVCGWAGDDPTVTLTATLRQECAWAASVPAVPALTPQRGYGSAVQWSFSCADFADGSYSVRIDLPELSLWRERSLLVDHQRGEAVAQISQPVTGLLKEAVVSVTGSACYSEDGHEVSYQLAVKDERGEWLIVCPRQNDPHCAALLPARARPAATEAERRFYAVGAVVAAELALLDLSGLPDGRYELHLEVAAGGQCAADQVVFQLASDLKSGPLSWQEQDLRVPTGAMVLIVTRKYASDALHRDDFGPGWSLNLSAMDVVIPEERAELKDVFGKLLSIRQGGSRDVCVTMPDGRRVTFGYELVPGGGMSFCYYAQWRAPGNVAASLTPTVSNKLMALPDLDPYWEAAGMATPWEYYDFPAFTLSCEDGNKYLLEREYLGDAELLIGGAGGPDDGESYAHVAAYGQAQLREMSTRGGERIVFARDCVRSQSLAGRMKDIMKIERGHDGDNRITAIEALQGEQLRLEYAYDESGRLLQVWQGRSGQDRQLRRSYAYDDERFPYHLTAIRDGRGALLFAQRFDVLGRLCATTNADGAESTVLRDCIAGVELRTDPLGNETTILHDARGNISAVVAPDGALTSYEYDAAGRECAVTNPLGETNAVVLDDSGRPLARIEPLGQRTDYVYADNGRCRRIVDPLGRLTDYSMDTQGRNTSITTATGDVVTMSYDAGGRVSSVTGGEGMEPILVTYDEYGRPEAITDMRGLQLQSEYDESNHLVVKTLRFFTAGGSQISELSVAADYDDEGRLVTTCDSLNNWRKTTYDYRGRATQETASSGQCLNRRFDAMDRVVETWDDGGLLWRFLYDAAGQQVLAAGPFALSENQREQPPEMVIFPQAERRLFDACGRLSGLDLLQDVAVIRDETGGGQYRCQLLASGNSLASATRDYDAAGRLRGVCSLAGVEQYFDYDANGRCVGMHDGAGRGQHWEYDAIGNVIALTDAAGNQTLYSYDERGLPTAVIDPGGGITLSDYDTQGRLRSTQNPAGLLVSNGFTPDGQLVSVRLAHSGEGDNGDSRRAHRRTTAGGEGGDDCDVLAEYRYEYNATLGLSAIIDPLGRRRDFVVDEFGRECRQRLPMGEECTVTYDNGAFLPTRRCDFLGNSVVYRYDAQGNLCEKRVVAADDVASELLYRYRYDAFGRCAGITLTTGDDDVAEPLLTCEYNGAGRIVRQDNTGVVLQCEYDADMRLTRQWTEHTDLHYAYDSGGALASVELHKAAGRELSQPDQYGFEYDAAGRLRQLRRPDGSTSNYTVDGRGLVTAIRYCDDQQITLQESSYEYDIAGRCVGVLDGWNDDGATRRERRRSYRYDTLGRLRQEESWCEGLAAFCYSMESSYDAAGNRIKTVHTDASGAMTVRTFAYDANDRLLKEEVQTAAESYQILYSWDANGSLLSRVAGGAYPDERRYRWDAENRLVAVHINQPKAASGAVQWSIYYDYDARGMLSGCTRERQQNQLVERSRYRLVMTPPESDSMPVLLECQRLAGTPDEELQSFVHAGQLLARNGADGEAWQCVGDRLGTVSAEGSGAMWLRQGYDAHGLPLLPSRETPGHGFAGEWQDPVTGLVYLRSRFYAPELGAFISRDAHPGQLSQPMSLHKYAYCFNDPVNRCDPGGCFSMLSCMSAMWSGMSSAAKAVYTYRVPLQIATELAWGFFSLSDFMTRDAEQANATVVVHGVMPHFPGYSKDLTDGLDGRIDNQDYYEFLWSGFSMAIMPWLPNPLQHGIAKASLRNCLLAVAQKGYRHLSLIGHSWGTVLSLDALEQRDVPIHTWVTMGSPLPRVSPRFPFRNWLNVFSPSDPVVYMEFAPFFRFSDEPMEPLFAQESPPEQHGVGNRPLLEAHSCYWTDYMTIKLIANLLKVQ